MKKLLSLFLSVCMVLSLMTVSIAADEETTFFGYITDSAWGTNISDPFDEALLLQFCDATGAYAVEACESRVWVNGTRYDTESEAEKEALQSAIPLGVFAKFTMRDNKITRVDFDEMPVSYQTMEYAAAGQFQGDGGVVDTTGLPIYYLYDDELVIPTLDGNHVYNIEVYDYAVLITDFEAKDKPETIHYIDIASGISPLDFKQTMSVLCGEIKSSSVFKAQLFAASGQLLAEQEGRSLELTFEALPNENVSYTVKLWQENEDGEAITPVYTRDYTTEQIPVTFGLITATAWGTNIFDPFDEAFLLQISDTTGAYTVYACASRVWINGTRYTTESEAGKEALQLAISTGVFVKFVTTDGKITALQFDDTAVTYQTMEYTADGHFQGDDGEVDTTGLPIYYLYDGAPVMPTVDGNHLYNIEVYDYAVLITAFWAKDYPETIRYIDIASGVSSYDFKQSIDVYCEATTNQATLKAQLYTADGQLVAEQESWDLEWQELSFMDLPNADVSYTIKLWIEDVDGEALSPVYTRNYSTEQIPVSFGQVVASAISGGFEDVLQLKINENGEDVIYSCASRIRVYGSGQIRDVEAAQAAITIGSYARFTVENGEITTIRLFDVDHYTVEFNANGGTGTYAPQQVEAGDFVTVPDKPVREGFVFTGWYEDDTCSGMPYITASGTVNFVADENATLYAGWKEAPRMQATAVKSDAGVEVKVDLENVDEPCRVMVACYRGGKFVGVKCVEYTGILRPIMLGADIDTIKVMAWGTASLLNPFCRAETIPSTNWDME